MNTIRELKQQEKYKNMLKRKNKEKKIYKDKNSSLRIKYEGIKKLLDKKDKEIERLNNIINELEESLKDDKEEYNKDLDLETKELYNEYWRGYSVCADKNLAYLQELKGDGSNE